MTSLFIRIKRLNWTSNNLFIFKFLALLLNLPIENAFILWAIPFNVHTPTPPHGWIFLKGDPTVVSEGLSLSASFDLCDFSG
jgi:hypothetical protein